MRVILVSGYFGADLRESKLNYFARLDERLRLRGMGLYLLGLSSRPIPAPLRGESIPRLIEKSHWLPIGAARPRSVAPEIHHGASIDAECWNRSPEREEVRVLLFREHLRTILRREKPVLAIAWHQFFGMHYGFNTLLERFGVPWRYAEFGPLPGTILFDEDGQGAESPIATRCEEFAHQSVHADDRHQAEEFLSRVRTEKRTRKPQMGEGAVRAAVQDALRRGQKIVFYAGQYDCRTGMVPRTLPQSTTHSPLFADTLEALSYLSGLAKRNDWLILFKPHPLAGHTEEAMRSVEAPDRVVTLPGANLFECLDVAHAVVTIVSQVSYMSLIFGRPCVMLGRSYLAGKSCVGEPEDRDEIEPLIEDAIETGITSEQQERWLRHVAQLLKYGVFAFDEGFTAPGLRTLDDTAAYLEACCAAPQALQEPDSSAVLDDVMGNERSARRLRRLYSALRVF